MTIDVIIDTSVMATAMTATIETIIIGNTTATPRLSATIDTITAMTAITAMIAMIAMIAMAIETSITTGIDDTESVTQPTVIKVWRLEAALFSRRAEAEVRWYTPPNPCAFENPGTRAASLFLQRHIRLLAYKVP